MNAKRKEGRLAARRKPTIQTPCTLAISGNHVRAGSDGSTGSESDTGGSPPPPSPRVSPSWKMNDDWNFPIFKLESKQLLSATNSVAYGVGSSGKPAPSVFRRRLSIGHFRASDVSLDQLKQFRRQIADGETVSQGKLSPPTGTPPSSSTPALGRRRRNQFRSASMTLAPPLESPSCSPSGSTHELVVPGLYQEPSLSDFVVSTTPYAHSQGLTSIGFPTKYLPCVLAGDMKYDGIGLVANVDSSFEDSQYYAPDGEAVLAELAMPQSAADMPLLDELDEWNYPIFELACETGGGVVSRLIFKLFQSHGLFAELDIPHGEFLAYFQALEAGYQNNPYHNRVHAADVLHSMAYLLNTEILGFNVAYCDSSVAGHGIIRDFSRTEIESVLEEDTLASSSCRAMRDALSPLELAACFIAAAQHDYDHPARTNSFLVTTHADLALLYNDRAVLEQHHAASSWKMLLCNPAFNFLKNMSAGDVRILRSLSLELILATDLAKHFEIISSFQENLSSGDTFLKAREDRLSIMQMCIKIADINGPTKNGPLHRKWAYLICEEFYEQGREEAALNLPISPYMDKGNPLLPKLQISFIGNLLRPLLAAYSNAGFMPGPYELVNESEVQELSSGGNKCPQSSLGRLHDNVVSVIVKNANQNEAFWQAILRREESTVKATVKATLSRS